MSAMSSVKTSHLCSCQTQLLQICRWYRALSFLAFWRYYYLCLETPSLEPFSVHLGHSSASFRSQLRIHFPGSSTVGQRLQRHSSGIFRSFSDIWPFQLLTWNPQTIFLFFEDREVSISNPYFLRQTLHFRVFLKCINAWRKKDTEI